MSVCTMNLRSPRAKVKWDTGDMLLPIQLTMQPGSCTLQCIVGNDTGRFFSTINTQKKVLIPQRRRPWPQPLPAPPR